MLSAREVGQRINRRGTAPYLEVQMGPACTPCPAHPANHSTRFHPAAFTYQIALIVCISSKHITTVSNNDQLAITAQTLIRVDHFTCCCGIDGGALFRPYVNAIMHTAATPAKAAGHFGIQRPA